MMTLKPKAVCTLILLLLISQLGSFLPDSLPSDLQVHKVQAAGESWLTGYTYRRSHTLLNATGAGTDYQMNITIYAEDLYNYLADEIRYIWTQSLASPAGVYHEASNCTFIGWQGNSTDLDAHVTVVNHTSGEVSSYFIGDNPLTDDAHGSPIIIITDDNYLHAFYGCHQSNLKHAKSDNPQDASAWTLQADVVGTCTYPQAIKLSNGTVLLFYRKSAGGKMDLSYMKSNDNCSSWTGPTDLTNVAASTYIYPQVNVWRPDGVRLNVAWTMLNTDGQNERHNLYYGYFNVTDGQMYNVSGSNLGTLTQAEMDSYCKVYDSGSAEVAYDSWPHTYSSSNPHVVTALETGDESGEWNLTDAYWDGDSWELENILGYNRSDGTYGRPCSFMNGTNSIMLYWCSGPLVLKVIKWNGTAWSLVTSANHNSNSPRYGSGEGLSDPKPILNGRSDLRIAISEEYYGNYGTDLWLYGYGDGEGDLGWFLRSDYPYDNSQVAVTSGIQADWEDIRITGSDGKTLWPIYNTSSTATQVKIWFKVPDDLSSSNVTMYLYWGNSTVSSGYTLGDNVFIAWDDFDHGYTAGNELNSSRGWDECDDVTIQNNPTGRSGMGLKVNSQVGADIEAASNNLSAKHPSLAFHYFWHIDGLDLRNGYFNLQEDETVIVSSMDESGHRKFYDGDSWDLYVPDCVYAANTWYEMEHRAKANYYHLYRGTTDYVASLRNAIVDGIEACRFTSYSVNDYVFTYYVDEFFVRKWLSTEPAHSSWGALETYSEGGNGENHSPSVDSYSISQTEVPRGTLIWFSVTATDIDGIADIARIRLRIKDWSDAPYDSRERIDLLWNSSTSSFSLSWNWLNWATLNTAYSVKTNVDSDTITVTYYFSIDDFLRDPAWMDFEAIVYDTAGYGSGIGLDNYFRLYIPGGSPGTPSDGDGTNGGYIPPGSIPPSEGEWPPGTWPPGYIPPGSLPPSQGGQYYLPLKIQAFAARFRIPQGETRTIMMTVTWSGVNTLKIEGLEFAGSQAHWPRVEDLPVVMMKEFSAEEGQDTVPVIVSVPYDADLGDYVIPAIVDAKASGTALSTGSWLAFEVVEPAAGTIFPLLPDWMTLLLLLVVAVILIYAYMRD